LKHRVLSEHFGKVKGNLLSLAEHFDIAKHGDIKGYGREALVNEFLKSHLPDQVEYLTGEILDHQDSRSGQVDIILQSKLHPKIPLWGNVHLAFCDAVIAAIEVKSTLTSQHLDSTLHNFAKIKGLNRNVSLSMNGANALPTIPCILFAFKGLKKDTIIKSINQFATKHKVPLEMCSPDMVVVLNQDFYICRNDGWQFPVVPHPRAFFRDWAGLPHENLVGCYNYLNNVIHAFASKSVRLDAAMYFEKSILRNDA
jgi:hypothetical protein